jgi:orotidine-5'-phosphate decarboxylase
MKARNLNLCLGIDPNPQIKNFHEFNICVDNHIKSIELIEHLLPNKQLKLNLAFFLTFGSKGIELLEQICEKFKNNFTIILDGKFNEISNSLQAYLNFVFETLGVHGITINPFLGENTLKLAFETCLKKIGEKGRVYVLCVTSEGPTSTLAYLQENWENKISACVQMRDEIFGNQANLKKCAGVVIGANKEEILFSPELIESELSILAPGLGYQGGDFHILPKCLQQKNEFTFPLSRSLFNGGNQNPQICFDNILKIIPYFEEKNGSN